MAAAISTEAGSIAASRTVALFAANFTRGIYRPPYDVARDGRFLIALDLNQAATAPITLLMNWKAPR